MDDWDSKLEDEPRNHPFLWGLALFFLILSVPFYYPSGRTPVLIEGLPDWCWVTLLSDFCFAVIVGVMIHLTWKEKEPPGPDPNANSRGT